LDTRAHKCFPTSGGWRSPAKKKPFDAGKYTTHKINCVATILSQDSGFCSNHIFFVTGSLCSFPRFSPPVSAIRKIFSQSDFPQIALSVAFRRAERRASGPVGATPLGRAGGREHDILWRQNVSEAAGAAAEHEGRPVESERGRVVARMVR